LNILPLIISIVGYSKSGKTTLLEKMIPILTGKGYSVGVIKHSGHGFSLDQPEKDSQRLGRAGADGVVLVGAGQIGFLGKTDEKGDLILDRIEQSFFPDQDILLTEGFKKGNKPKIAVLTEGKEEQLFQEVEGNVVATVGERPFRKDLPHFKPDDPEGLVQLLEQHFLKDRRKPSIRVILDGKNIPMNAFVQEIVHSGIMGILSPLKGFRESQKVEVKIGLQDKGKSR
jgi:molybdopterin-guanine dinucleotide biosynthesis protein B